MELLELPPTANEAVSLGPLFQIFTYPSHCTSDFCPCGSSCSPQGFALPILQHLSLSRSAHDVYVREALAFVPMFSFSTIGIFSDSSIQYLTSLLEFITVIVPFPSHLSSPLQRVPSQLHKGLNKSRDLPFFLR